MKIALVGDLHFGVKNSDKYFRDSQFAFLKSAVRYCVDSEINDMFIMGDLFDTRHSLNVLTMNEVVDFFYREIPRCLKIWIILGNHDLYYKNTVKVNSLVALKESPSVVIVDKPIKFDDDTLLVPWVTDYEEFRNEVEGKFDCKRIFGHFDVIGAKMDNFNVSMNGFDKRELFEHWRYVYSGHYHKHSETEVGDNKLIYVGTPYQLNRSEIEEKGFYILDTEMETTSFVKNDHCIEYRKLRYPEMPEDPETFVKGHIIDVDISWEDSKYMNKVNDYIDLLESYGPAYPVNANYQRRIDKVSTETIDTSKITLLGLAKKYIEDSEDIKNKSRVFDAFKNLYSSHVIH